MAMQIEIHDSGGLCTGSQSKPWNSSRALMCNVVRQETNTVTILGQVVSSCDRDAFQRYDLDWSIPSRSVTRPVKFLV